MAIQDVDLPVKLLGVGATILATFSILFFLIPVEIIIVVAAISGMATLYYTVSIGVARYTAILPNVFRSIPIWFTLFLPASIGVVLLVRYWRRLTLLIVILVVALAFVFFYYWFIVPLALYQKIEQQNQSVIVDSWPAVSVLVPAYNEAGYIGRCIQALRDSDYPAEIEIFVIDDGSTDDTYMEAKRHADDSVTIFSKENGGKHSALNYAIPYTTNEIVVCVDADSIVTEHAIRKLVRALKAYPKAGAVAGNVKVKNRGSLITDLQALEYVLGINTFRRAFDLLGVVTVVPGCLGGFRREALEVVGGYDPDTLTEDFDLTIQLLKEGHRIHMSEGIVFTEVPSTWYDLYKQRLRWYRGNLQTLIKHAGVFADTKFGLLHRLAFPYTLFSMSILPLLGMVILSAIVVAISQGYLTIVLKPFAFFSLLQVLLSILAIEIEKDEFRLALYAPLSIVGYKQFQDTILLKSIADVFLKDDLRWTRSRRVHQIKEEATEETEVRSDD